MTRHFSALLAVTMGLGVACGSDPETGAPLALVGGRIYSSPGAEPIDGGVVIVDDNRIAFVGPLAAANLPESARRIDCTGRTIVAGFWNSHVHIDRDSSRSLEAMSTRYGFTTIVDTGSSLDDTLALRKRIEAGDLVGPRILTAGFPLYPENGIPYYVEDAVPRELLSQLLQPGTPGETATLVNRQLDRGADLVKLFAVSWVRRDGKIGPRPMALDQMRAAVEAAHARGKLVFAHPSTREGVELVLASGVDVLAHSSERLEGEAGIGWSPELVERVLAGGVSLIPTLTLFSGNEEALAQVRAYAGRGRILFGTDAGYLTDYESLTAEFGWMARAGMTFSQILESLTTAPAGLFGFASTGRIEPGFDADLVVLDGDPAEDINHFARVVLTLRRGDVLYAAE